MLSCYSLRIFAVERDNWKNIYSPARLCHLICDLLPSLPGFVRCGRRGSRYGARHVDFAPFGHHGSLAEPRLLTGREGLVQRTFAAYKSDFRKRVTSRNTPTPTRTYLLLKYIQWIGVYNHSHSLKFCHGSSLLTSPFIVHVQYMYTCIVSRESTLTASWVVVLETALRQCMRQRLLWDSRSRKSKKRSLLPLRRDMMSL